jgi:hypothetical protein
MLQSKPGTPRSAFTSAAASLLMTGSTSLPKLDSTRLGEKRQEVRQLSGMIPMPLLTLTADVQNTIPI